MGEHPEGGEADRPAHVGGRGEYGHDGADHEFGVVRHLELRLDDGQGVREVVVAGHRQGCARDPEDQGEERAERGHRGAHPYDRRQPVRACGPCGVRQRSGGGRQPLRAQHEQDGDGHGRVDDECDA